MSIEVMKQALEALEKLWLLGDYAGAIAAPPIQALRIAIAAHGSQAIEQAGKEEPCEYCKRGLKTMCLCHLKPPTAPAQQPLEKREIMNALMSVDPETKRLAPGFEQFARAIEAAHGIKGASL